MGDRAPAFVSMDATPAAMVRAWEWVGDDGFRIVFLDRVRADLWAGHNHGRLYPLVREVTPGPAAGAVA